MNSPKVSIVIPVYNGSNYLREAIDSALAQTYKNIEVVVVNDGSTDNGATEAIAKSYGDKIRYFAKKNGGVSTALNLGIEKMTGEYFSWLSHDDIYLPEKISEQISFLNKLDNQTAILYSDYEYIDQNSRYISTHKVPHIDSNELRFRLMDNYPVHGCTILVPRACFSIVGPFDPNYLVVQDVEMFLRLSRKFEFIHIPKVLIQSRLHTTQGSKNLTPEQTKQSVAFLNQYFQEIIHEVPQGNATRYLLKIVMTINNSSFHDSAVYAYQLAKKEIQKNPSQMVKHFPRLIIYWITQLPFWRKMRLFTIVPYRNTRKFLFKIRRVLLQSKKD